MLKTLRRCKMAAGLERDYLKDKVTKEQLKELTARSLWPWLRDALMDWGIMLATIALAVYWNNPIGYFFAILVLGNRQHALAVLGHDATHFTLSKNKKLNDFLGGALAWYPLGITNSGYRNLHNQHHIHLNTEKDPEIVHKKSRAPQWDIPISPAQLLKYAALDLVGYSIPDYWIIVSFSKPNSRSAYVALAAYHLAINSVLIACGLWWVPALWYGALITSFMMFFRLRLWLEHQGTELVHRLHLNWWQAALFYPHLAWHHWEHHQWPPIPYHRLPEFRSFIPDVPVVTLGDLIKHFQSLSAISSGTPLADGMPNASDDSERGDEVYNIAA